MQNALKKTHKKIGQSFNRIKCQFIQNSRDLTIILEFDDIKCKFVEGKLNL